MGQVKKRLEVRYGKNPRPLVVETNLDYALAYWSRRKANDPQIRFTIKRGTHR